MYKWTEVLRKNPVEICLEAHARGNLKKTAEWSRIEERFNAISGEINANKQQIPLTLQAGFTAAWLR